MPLKDVVELHRTSAENMSGGVSLNDVQLVQTYVVENTLAVHVETFARDPTRRGSSYGMRTWVGGMAIHMITDETEGPAVERSQQFVRMPTEKIGDLTEGKGKLREKKERKKANLEKKKQEEAAALEEKKKEEEAERRKEKDAKRKAAMIQPHQSLLKMMTGDDDVDDGMFIEEAPLTEEELALFSVPKHREGLLQPHPSLTKLLSDKAARVKGEG